jgi:peptidoglycan/xylan/chitin deacetylase (PgdA/CDA1 family)
LRRKLFLIGGVLLATSIVLAGLFYLLVKNDQYQLFGKMTYRVETDEKVVALTFDDGPTPDRTIEILAVLDKENVKATFFLNGNSLSSYPEAGKLLVNSGHEIGNHSYSHKRMVLMSYADIAQEIESTEKIIRKHGYSGPLHFRPPFGKKLFNLPLYLRNHDIRTITWDVEPETWDTPRNSTSDRIERGVSNTKPGSIILLHVMHGDNKSMQAVTPIIQQLKAKGFRFVTVSELLRYSTMTK